MSHPTPTELTLHEKSHIMEVVFDNGAHFELPYEYLRVYSPSAEVQGHGPGQAVLQTEKENVSITQVRPVGRYGITPVFSDGHDSGIYTWKTLYYLGMHRETLWNEYIQKLKEAGYQRNE